MKLDQKALDQIGHEWALHLSAKFGIPLEEAQCLAMQIASRKGPPPEASDEATTARRLSMRTGLPLEDTQVYVFRAMRLYKARVLAKQENISEDAALKLLAEREATGVEPVFKATLKPAPRPPPPPKAAVKMSVPEPAPRASPAARTVFGEPMPLKMSEVTTAPAPKPAPPLEHPLMPAARQQAALLVRDRRDLDREARIDDVRRRLMMHDERPVTDPVRALEMAVSAVDNPAPLESVAHLGRLSGAPPPPMKVRRSRAPA